MVHSGRLANVPAYFILLLLLLLQADEYALLSQLPSLGSKLSLKSDGRSFEASGAVAWLGPTRLVVGRVEAAMERGEPLPRKFLALLALLVRACVRACMRAILPLPVQHMHGPCPPPPSPPARPNHSTPSP